MIAKQNEVKYRLDYYMIGLRNFLFKHDSRETINRNFFTITMIYKFIGSAAMIS